MANGFNNIKIHCLDSLACSKINTQFLRASESMSTLVGFSGILPVPTVLQLQTHSHL